MVAVVCESEAEARAALAAGAGVVLMQLSRSQPLGLSPSEGSPGKDGAGGRIALFIGSSAKAADVTAAVAMAEELFGTPVTVRLD